MLTDEAHNARMANIRKDHWLRFETDSEHEERAASCEGSAAWYYRNATEAQRKVYQRVLMDSMGDYSPRADRARLRAEWRFLESTTAARELLAETFNELMSTGEVSEEMSDRWDALPVYVEMEEVAA